MSSIRWEENSSACGLPCGPISDDSRPDVEIRRAGLWLDISVAGVPLASAIGVLACIGLVAVALTPNNILRLLAGIGSSSEKLTDPIAQVWVIQGGGNYYCRGSVLFGRKPGKFMKQGDALTSGYQPAIRNYCQEVTPALAEAPATWIQLGDNARWVFDAIALRFRRFFSGSWQELAELWPPSRS
jgi:hypothetical protein